MKLAPSTGIQVLNDILGWTALAHVLSWTGPSVNAGIEPPALTEEEEMFARINVAAERHMLARPDEAGAPVRAPGMIRRSDNLKLRVAAEIHGAMHRAVTRGQLPANPTEVAR